MIPLTTPEQFEELLRGYDVNGNPGPSRFLIWFSAAWCGPCQKMDKTQLEAAAWEKAIPFYYCDETVIEGAASRANITSLPTFVFFKKGEGEASRRNSSDATKVCQWIKKL